MTLFALILCTGILCIMLSYIGDGVHSVVKALAQIFNLLNNIEKARQREVDEHVWRRE